MNTIDYMKHYLSTQSVLWGVAILGAIIILVTFLLVNKQETKANTFPGSVATIGLKPDTSWNFGSTTSQVLVVHTPTQVMGSSTCAARTVTVTGGGDITLSFYDGAPVLGQYNGHLQLASTTVTYDGEQVGCGMLKAFAVASTTITVSETR